MTRVIAFHYTLTDELGEVLDSSAGREPLAFLEGQDQIIPGLEKELAAMQVGDRQRVEVKAADAYGEVEQALVMRVHRSQFPAGVQLSEGDQFRTDADPSSRVFTIVEVDEDSVTIDGNHPLAGRDLVFDVNVVSVREATAEEVAHGHVHGEDGHEAH